MMKLMTSNRGIKGFTLIELMIVVVIIGIIAAIAFPSYLRYVERTQFNDGRSGLVIAAQALERCYITGMSYAGCAFPGQSPERFYTIALSAPAGQTFTLQATGRAGRVAAGDCSSITLNHAGVWNQGACPH
jgi:type IV pilus assembly protein PilE